MTRNQGLHFTMELFYVKMDQTVMKSLILILRFVFQKDKYIASRNIKKAQSGVT